VVSSFHDLLPFGNLSIRGCSAIPSWSWSNSFPHRQVSGNSGAGSLRGRFPCPEPKNRLFNLHRRWVAPVTPATHENRRRGCGEREGEVERAAKRKETRRDKEAKETRRRLFGLSRWQCYDLEQVEGLLCLSIGRDCGRLGGLGDGRTGKQLLALARQWRLLGLGEGAKSAVGLWILR